MANKTSPPDSPLKDYETPSGAHFQVDFAWSKFRNVVSEKIGDKLAPVYIQHFRPLKPQLRIDDAATNAQISTGTIHKFRIAAECIIHGQAIEIKPLSKWKTAYNYISPTLSPSGPVAISWITNSNLKTWDFICLDSATQTPIAKFAANWWALKEVGNFYFTQPAADLSKEVRDEVITVGLTIVYVMMMRMNNPLQLLGASFAKPGKVEDDLPNAGSAGLEERPDEQTKHKQV